jgi:hypothetical protein
MGRQGTDDLTGAAIEWLLTSDEPSVRRMVRRDLLGEAPPPFVEGPWIRALLHGIDDVHPYRKWVGAHWRLVSLVELDFPAGDPRILAAVDSVLRWLTGRAHRRGVKVINGLARRCASQEGNALAVCSRLGLTDDPRVDLLAESLIDWQWPDGGWNCDPDATGRRSSFHETLPAMWGLYEYAWMRGSGEALVTADRAADLLLGHRVFRSTSTGEPIHPSVLVLHYPPYWHYDILQALVILARMGLAADPRASDALDLIEQRRLPDGRWRPGGYWWATAATGSMPPDVVDWGHSGPNVMLTLNALRVLHAAGRLGQPAGRFG